MEDIYPQQITFGNPVAQIPFSIMGSGTYGLNTNYQPGSGYNYVDMARWNPQALPKVNVSSNPLFGNPFDKKNFWDITNPTGEVIPGAFSTAMPYVNLGKDLFGAWNTYQAGKIAKENLEMQKEALKNQTNFARLQIDDALTTRAARNKASVGGLTREEAYAAAESDPKTLSKMAKYGLA